MSKPTDLVQGTLDLLILKVIALEPMHGWAIAQRIHQMSGDVLQVGQSALYPSLHKLEQNGWISAEWAVSENNRRAKYYTLTRGRSQGARAGSGAMGAPGLGDLPDRSYVLRSCHAPAQGAPSSAAIALCSVRASSRSSTRSCAITSNARSKRKPRGGMDPPTRRAAARAIGGAGSSNGKRSVATCGD